MSLWSDLLNRAAPEEHLVQLYGEDDRLLVRNLVRYLGEGLRRGDALVVIATPEHARAITLELTAAGPAAAAAAREGWLVVLDARETLDRFLVDGRPNADRFFEIVGGIVEEARRCSASGRVRAFGEMVGLLWMAGRRTEALSLEDCWNDLLRGSACSLFCAYPIDAFEQAEASGDLRALLGPHTHMSLGPMTLLSSGRGA
jgi:MEDS: MEthanogen/methylotroph, DcmR Sensory domain